MKKELTAQQIFEKVAKHLAKQGKRAEKDGVCRNYTEEGLRCAFGCLLPVAWYKKHPEVWTLPCDIREELTKRGINAELQATLINDMATVHDTKKVSRWAQNLRGVARKHKLTIPDWLKAV